MKTVAKNGQDGKLRVLALLHHALVPPDEADEAEVRASEWKTEYDVMKALRALGHDVLPLGVGSDLGVLRKAVEDFKPDIAFNLLEGFDDVPIWDQNVVAYLELLKVRYTGCNARGLLLAKDKAIAKKLLTYHRIPVADFVVFPAGKPIRRPKRLAFPLIVKSLTMDASIGISQASVVDTEEKLLERVCFIHDSIGTDALVESYIEGREVYVGIIGNERLTVLPPWELLFTKMPEEQRRIATERLKWSLTYQKKHGITSAQAKDLPDGAARKLEEMCRRVYRSLMLTGYARVDLRIREDGTMCVIEANPNPQLSRDEDFAESAVAAGMTYERLLRRILVLGMRWEPSQIG